jgi:polysaccharide pyruvyl transferase WcaK-like protein
MGAKDRDINVCAMIPPGKVNSAIEAFDYGQPNDQNPGIVNRKNDQMKQSGKKLKVGFFGHFGTNNFGNEATLHVMLHHLTDRFPNAEITCICSGPEAVTAVHGIKAFPISPVVARKWHSNHRMIRFLRKVFIGMPCELYRWLLAFRMFKKADLFIIPGTGLLTDAYSIFGWGPYSLFKWALMAKAGGCKLLFVSVGAGPLYGVLGKYFVKTALSFADFRSYRDRPSKAYLERIGFPVREDRLFPDLVFSLPEAEIPPDRRTKAGRPVVGLGLMEYAGKYSIEHPSRAVYLSYLENLVVFVEWLLAHGYEIRLLIGDTCDTGVKQDLRSLLKERLGTYDDSRITDRPISSVPQLLAELAETDIVAATRFHNVLLALLLNKPVVAISFHHKCTALMNEMGLAEYCHDINHMNASRLMEQFLDVEKNTDKLKQRIREKVEQFRNDLDEQYNVIFKNV